MRTFLILALLATTQAITKKDDSQSPPVEGKEETCEKNSDGITHCVAPGSKEWSVNMNHPEDSQEKKYKSMKLDSPSGRKDAPPAPLLKDPSSQMANAGLEMSAAKK